MNCNPTRNLQDSLLNRFRRDGSGGVAVLFAIALPTLLGVTGLAVDYTAVAQSRGRLQVAVDSAALALAREMTVGHLTAQRLQDSATQLVNSNLGNDAAAAQVKGVFAENGLAISIKASLALKTPLGLVSTLSGAQTMEAHALARVSAASAQTKLCMLSLGEKINGGLMLHNGAQIVAPGCTLHSNSTQADAFVIQQASKVSASLACARGGIRNLAGMLDAQLITDCPAIRDPLANKPEPPTDRPCDHPQPKIFVMGTHTLQPGTYCGGIYAGFNAKITMAPGIYVLRDGPLLFGMNAELRGNGVSLVLTGKKSVVQFHQNAYVQISAPTSGIAAGMLIWESQSWIPGVNTWLNGGCGTVPSGAAAPGSAAGTAPSADEGPQGCNSVQSFVKQLKKKSNEHHINSARAREFTGTIYLPRGMLLIDSRMPVADQSAFTVLVVNKLDLYDGPVLTLNSNYAGSPVPVPKGLGMIGATQVRLGMPTP
jgi:Flp pilus assembly protein TadG